MRPWNPLSIGRDGAPITGRVPVRLVVLGGTLTGTQAAAVQSFFVACCEEHRLSAVPYFSRHRVLGDGTSAKVTIHAGSASVVAVVQQSGAEGIGVRLVGWDGALLPDLSSSGEANYYLIRQGKKMEWVVRRMPLLVGGRNVWVSSDRGQWLSTTYADDVQQASAYYKNKLVFNGPTPQATYAPAVRAARRGEAMEGVPTPTSFLNINGSALELLQATPDGAYATTDSTQVGGGGGALEIVGAAGNSVLAVAGETAYTIAISPMLEIVREQSITAAEDGANDPVSSINYAAVKMFVPGTPTVVPFSNTAHYASAPDLATVTRRGSAEDQYYDPTYYQRVSEMEDQLRAAGSGAFTVITFAPPPTTGFWSASQPAGTKTVGGPTVLDSCAATYTESYNGDATAIEIPWRGMTHGGDLVQISRRTKTTESLAGTTAFSFASPSVAKTVTRKIETTWELPNGSISHSYNIQETYEESTTVPFPSLYPATGSMSSRCTVSGTKMDLLHYDHDTDCAVFLKRAVGANGTATWRKSSVLAVDLSPEGAHISTPLGSVFLFQSKEPTLTSSGSVQASVCAYIGGALTFEEVLATMPCRTSQVMYEPKVYADMRFDFSANTPKPDDGYWPETTDVYGPGTPESSFIHTPTMMYGRPLHPVNYHIMPKSIMDGPYSAAEKAAAVVHLQTSQMITFFSDGYVECGEFGEPIGFAGTKVQIGGTTNYVLGDNVYLVTTVGPTVVPEDIIQSNLVKAATWAGSPQIYPATAAEVGSFYASASAAKEARTGNFALEISYSYDGFAEPKTRSLILLVNSAGVTRLDDLLKPPSGGGKYEFKTTFLATI